MTQSLCRLIAAAAIVIGPLAAHGTAQTAPAVPPIPANLTVPAGNSLFLVAHAVGTQNYICILDTAAPAWRFLGPQATLFQTLQGELQQQLTTHYLSADATEARVARPTWQHSFDSSKVWGRVRASSTDPGYVEAGAIAWLLLEAAATEPGPTGGDVLAQTTFIHRLSTSGGVAPKSGCTKMTEVGTLALVPYQTDYYFYRAAQEQ